MEQVGQGPQGGLVAVGIGQDVGDGSLAVKIVDDDLQRGLVLLGPRASGGNQRGYRSAGP